MSPLAAGNPLFPSLLAVKHWSKMLSMSARDTTAITPLMGEDENSIIQDKSGGFTEGQTAIGNAEAMTLYSFTEGQTAIGNAEAMTLFSQAALINETGTTCAPPSQDSIDHQRIPFDLRDEAKGLLVCGSASAGRSGSQIR